MVYTFDYDNSHTAGPALPIVEFQLSAIGSAEGVILTALVDSGADATVLPINYLKQAKIEQVGRAQMRWGPHISENGMVQVTFTFRPHDYNGLGNKRMKKQSASF